MGLLGILTREAVVRVLVVPAIWRECIRVGWARVWAVIGLLGRRAESEGGFEEVKEDAESRSDSVNELEGEANEFHASKGGDLDVGAEQIIETLHTCHRHVTSPSVPVGRPCGVPSVGSVGALGWVRGRGSARLWSAWCCPGCGLYGDGTLCMTCALDTHGGVNSCTNNSTNNLRVVHSSKLGGGTKTLKASSGIKVGRPIVDNVPGSASLADYLRWAPRSWPMEAWECRVLHSPNVETRRSVLAGGCEVVSTKLRAEKVRFFLAGRCEVVSTKLRSAERSPVSPGPGEPLRSWLGWTPLLRTLSSGVWLFRGQYEGSSFLLRLCPQWTGCFGVPTALHGR